MTTMTTTEPIETIPKQRKRARDGSFRGDARPNSGRPKGIPNRWPAGLAKEIARLSEAIERKLGLREAPTAPRYSRRRPLGMA